MSSSQSTFSIRSVVIPIYLPTLLFSAGEAAIIPVIPAIANNLGADLSVAGLVASMLTVGILLGDLPGGAIVSRIGERMAMVWASVLALAGELVAVLAPNAGVLGLGILALGLATSVFALARHAFLTTFVPLTHRARALSTLGGMFRGGAVLGPLLTAGLLAIVQNPASALWITVIFTLGTTAVLLFMPDPEQSFGQVRRPRTPAHTAGEIEVEQETHGLFRTISRNWHILMRLGVATGVVAALRAGRSVLLPLWAVSIGVSTADTALVIGVASGLDFALFFVSGQIMDRFGRLSAIVPSMLGMSLPLIVLAFTHDWPTASLWFVVTALLMGVGNGLGAGINLTLASDLAPKTKPAPFLGAFRFTTDAGAATAPLVLSGLIGVASISIAAGSLGVLGLVGVAMMLRWVPRLVPYRGPKKAT